MVRSSCCGVAPLSLSQPCYARPCEVVSPDSGGDRGDLA
jgi:hypothetical protein